jgi:RNA polymerase sigma-70 factor (ECF subfamily)
MPRISIRQRPGTDVERLYREQGGRLWRAILLFAGDPDVASDAVAEAFAQVLRRGDAVRSAEAWVWKAAYRVAAGELKRRRDTVNPLPETEYEIPDAPVILSVAMRSLSPMQRAAVALHDYAGYTLREVAGITGSTTSAVGVHVHRGRRRLRKILEEESHG